MAYLIVSTVVTDDLYFANGDVKKGIAGGAGLYALAGIKVWSDDVILVTGVGKDFFSLHGNWFAQNRLSTVGLVVKGDHTPRTKITYFESGEREETPLYGAEHYGRMSPAPEDIAVHCRTARGVYVFRNTEEDFWKMLLQLKQAHQFQLMWEIAADAAIPQQLETVTEIARQIDLFSINRKEAFKLFACAQIDDVVAKVRALGFPPVFLRDGKNGAYLLTADELFHAPSVLLHPVVDVTGGGNSSSATVLYGYCEGLAPMRTLIMANVSAACCIAQHGPPPIIDRALRRETRRVVDDMLNKL